MSRKGYTGISAPDELTAVIDKIAKSLSEKNGGIKVSRVDALKVIAKFYEENNP